MPAVGGAFQLMLAAAVHGRIFALALPTGKLDVESSPSTETSGPDRIRAASCAGAQGLYPPERRQIAPWPFFNPPTLQRSFRAPVTGARRGDA